MIKIEHHMEIKLVLNKMDLKSLHHYPTCISNDSSSSYMNFSASLRHLYSSQRSKQMRYMTTKVHIQMQQQTYILPPGACCCSSILERFRFQTLVAHRTHANQALIGLCVVLQKPKIHPTYRISHQQKDKMYQCKTCTSFKIKINPYISSIRSFGSNLEFYKDEKHKFCYLNKQNQRCKLFSQNPQSNVGFELISANQILSFHLTAGLTSKIQSI